MDDTRSCSRPVIGKTKTAVYAPTRPVTPLTRDGPDANHVTLVPMIALSGTVLKSMYLTKTEAKFADQSTKAPKDDLVLYATGSAYRTEASTTSYVTEVLMSNCEQVRNHLDDRSATTYLIMDHCAPHKTGLLLDMYAGINVTVIRPPAHSSHFLQPLDLACSAISRMCTWRLPDGQSLGKRHYRKP
jgi:hypothetical protein